MTKGLQAGKVSQWRKFAPENIENRRKWDCQSTIERHIHILYKENFGMFYEALHNSSSSKLRNSFNHRNNHERNFILNHYPLLIRWNKTCVTEYLMLHEIIILSVFRMMKNSLLFPSKSCYLFLSICNYDLTASKKSLI